jgi:hypothetical protein
MGATLPLVLGIDAGFTVYNSAPVDAPVGP